MAKTTQVRSGKSANSALGACAEPWTDIGGGAHLHIGHFLTFHLTRLARELKSTMTRRCLGDFELSVAEWRLLSMTVRSGPVRLAELVANTSMDKGQASRTCQVMRTRGYIAARAPSHQGGKKKPAAAFYTVTPKGQALYDHILPAAQRRQMELLDVLTEAERGALFRLLGKLLPIIESHHAPDEQ